MVAMSTFMYSFRESLGWLVVMIFGFFNSYLNYYKHFDYSAVVFFRAHLHTTLGILLKYNNQVNWRVTFLLASN